MKWKLPILFIAMILLFISMNGCISLNKKSENLTPTLIPASLGGVYTMKIGDKLDFGDGFSLTVRDVGTDMSGKNKNVWLEFDKNGQYIDDSVITDGNTWIIDRASYDALTNKVSVSNISINNNNYNESTVQISLPTSTPTPTLPNAIVTGTILNQENVSEANVFVVLTNDNDANYFNKSTWKYGDTFFPSPGIDPSHVPLTNSSGVFSISNVPYGEYSVQMYYYSIHGDYSYQYREFMRAPYISQPITNIGSWQTHNDAVSWNGSINWD